MFLFISQCVFIELRLASSCMFYKLFPYHVMISFIILGLFVSLPHVGAYLTGLGLLSHNIYNDVISVLFYYAKVWPQVVLKCYNVILVHQ